MTKANVPKDMSSREYQDKTKKSKSIEPKMNENQKRCQQEVVRRELLEFEKRTIRRKGSRKARSRLRRLRFNLYSEFTSALSFSALHFYGKGIVLNCHVAYYILSNRSIFVPVLLWVRCNPTLGS